MNEKELIQRCLEGNRQSQRVLYDHYSTRLFGVCRRYIRNDNDAEEILADAFYKIFTNLNKFEQKGSFEGWMYRITVNECLMFLRKSDKDFQQALEIETQYDLSDSTLKADSAMHEGDIMRLLDYLPVGYRTVFNMYVIEGYSHKEIAEMLQVSINTSKSQLIKARRMLQQLLQKAGYNHIVLPRNEEDEA